VLFYSITNIFVLKRHNLDSTTFCSY